MYGWQYQNGPGGWGIFMMLMMVLFWGLLVWGIVASVRHYSNSRAGQLFAASANPTSSSGAALEALRLRYAKGEIDDEEFERRRANLDKSGPTSS